MLQRSKFPKKKTVFLVNDVPIKVEIEGVTDRLTKEKTWDKFSGASNLNMLTSLRTGRINTYNATVVEGFKGILSTDIYTSYIDYTYYGEPELEKNFDYSKEIKKKKELVQDEGRFLDTVVDENNIAKHTEYFKLEHQKDVYLSERLYTQVQACIEEIKEVQPKLIIVTGKWSLFFLTGCTSLVQTQGNAKDRKPLGGLVKYRSSLMAPHSCWNIEDCILVPMYHPVHALGMQNKIPTMELDVQKLGYMYHKIKEFGIEYYTKPDKSYILGTDKNVVLLYLNLLLQKLEKGVVLLSVDVETMQKSFIDCIGITDSINTGLCIPFASRNTPVYWSLEDETDIMVKLREVLIHENARHIGQNYNYDCQFFFKKWNIPIKPHVDTMVLHHILYNYLPKDLAFLASLYCEHYTYWKDDLEATKESPETRWIYNVKDVCYTLEIHYVLLDILSTCSERLQELFWFQQHRTAPALVKTMNRGVRVDIERKEDLYVFFSGLMEDIKVKINNVLGFEFNQNSTPQKKLLFTDFFGMTLKVKKGKETCDAAAMLQYIEDYPLYRPFLTLLLEYASLKVFTNNFLGMKLDDDGRARTDYNIAGTGTGRLASRKNVWGKGGNLQNIPEKGKINLRYALEVMDEATEVDEDNTLYSEVVIEGSIILPNIKKIFLPDEGKEIADADYSGADAMIVAWDSECKWLIDFFKNRKDKLYAYIASMHLQREITSKSPEYKPYKAVCHGTNYGLGLDKLCSMLGISYEDAKELQDFYFGLCPEIKLWHERIKKDIQRRGYIENVFGRRGWFLDRNDPLLFNKAFAFIPQSSIADLVNHAMVNIVERHPEIDVLLQVHDSLVAQYGIAIAEESRHNIISCMEFYLPYSEPLLIPADLKVSTVSYGDTDKIENFTKRDYKIIENRLLEKI